MYFYVTVLLNPLKYTWSDKIFYHCLNIQRAHDFLDAPSFDILTMAAYGITMDTHHAILLPFIMLCLETQ